MDNWRLEKLKSLLKEDPKDDFLLYALAQEYLKSEKYQDAIKSFLDLQSANPSYVGLYYHLATAYISIEDYEMAKDTYDRGIKVAQEISDRHAESELKNAKINLEIEL